MNKIQIKDFNLFETIFSGQFFNFKQLDDFFIISDGQITFKVKQIGEDLFFEGCSKEHLFNFFGLNFNLDKLIELEDEYFQKAFSIYKGLRIMKIDLFQTIISFVCSAAANQKKIENNIRLISEKFGKYNQEFNFYSFPQPAMINDYSKLLECKVGYRAKYILGICEYLIQNPSFLEKVYNSNYHEAKNLLITLPGIGTKVADCICLFALNHYQAFPVDTWIKKMIKSWYGYESNNQKELENYIQDKFGNLGGYYQQYLFHLLRNEGL